MNESAVRKTEDFVAEQFRAHPHYSFNDWTVMDDHSRTVRNIALDIARDMDVDRTVVSIGALLHDIGKTYEADAETLHKQHEEFNLLVSSDFLDALDISPEQRSKIKEVIQHKSDSDEMRVIEDADALALYADERLHTLYINWARENDLTDAIQRKLDKFDKLNFKKSKEIGLPWFSKMKADWGIA